jgi:hypothetical protein
MLKSKLMTELKFRKGGEYIKENGHYYWLYLNEKHFVTTGWLIQKLAEVDAEEKQQKEEIKEIKKIEEVKIVQEEQPKPVKKSIPKKKKETETQQ